MRQNRIVGAEPMCAPAPTASLCLTAAPQRTLVISTQFRALGASCKAADARSLERLRNAKRPPKKGGLKSLLINSKSTEFRITRLQITRSFLLHSVRIQQNLACDA